MAKKRKLPKKPKQSDTLAKWETYNKSRAEVERYNKKIISDKKAKATKIAGDKKKKQTLINKFKR